MADPFSVDPEALADTLAQMTGFQRAAQDLLSEIESTVKNLHITWAGAAAEAHREAHGRWKQGAAQMQEALDRLHRAGSGAHGNFTGVISTNQKMWS